MAIADEAPPAARAAPAPGPDPGRNRWPVPMLWRAFAANALAFGLAFVLLAFSPVTIHASIRPAELAILLGGLIVMLLVDLVLLREALRPLHRLSSVMGRIDLLRPGHRATGFERSSREVLTLADAFNAMLDRLEDERRESSGRGLAAQEAERLRIARELHDEIGQALTAVALRAEQAARHGGTSEEQFLALAQIAQQSLEDVRRIALELRPGALDQLGLVNALISLCARVQAESGIRVHRRLQSPPTHLDLSLELALYRIAQEALTNVRRHSGAAEAELSLARRDEHLELTIVDHGRGRPAGQPDGAGVSGMRERAMLIGAALELVATPGGGLTVRLRLPLPEPL